MAVNPRRADKPKPRVGTKRLLYAILTISALAMRAQAQTPQSITPDRFAAVRASMQRWMDSTGAPSVAVAVAYNGKIVWEDALGWANREKRIRATPHTMYSLASITKSFTATALMILVERGQVSLETPANAYLGSGKLTARVGSENDATIRRVLSHTAGLPYHFQFFYANDGYSPPSMDETISRYGNLVFAPGTQYEYSNLGFGVLDHIIARTSRTSYAEFMRQRVFLPLGLLHTVVVEETRKTDIYAERYDQHQRPIPFYRFDHDGASAIYSSAHDLVRFGMFHLKNHLGDQRPILKDATLDLMHKPVPPAPYGLGFQVKSNDLGYYRVYHGGSMPGVNTMLRLYPTEHIAFAMLTNAEINFGGLLDDIVATLIPAFADSVRSERASNAARPASPPAVSFSPPASLIGDWTGAIHTWDNRSLDLTLSIDSNGVVIAKVGDQPVARVDRPRFQNGRFIGTIESRIPTADAGRWRHPIVLNLVLDDQGGLKGQATAVSSGDVSHFALSSFAELRKR